HLLLKLLRTDQRLAAQDLGPAGSSEGASEAWAAAERLRLDAEGARASACKAFHRAREAEGEAKEAARRAAKEEEEEQEKKKDKERETERHRAAAEEERRGAAEGEEQLAAERRQEEERRVAEEMKRQAVEEMERRRAADRRREEERRAAEEMKRQAAEEMERRRRKEERRAVEERGAAMERQAAEQEERRRRAAQDALREAAAQSDMEKITAAIQEGRASGLADGDADMKAARRRGHDLMVSAIDAGIKAQREKSNQAWGALEAAVLDADPGALREAVAHARRFGVDRQAIAIAEQKIEAEAWEALEAANAGGDLPALHQHSVSEEAVAEQESAEGEASRDAVVVVLVIGALDVGWLDVAARSCQRRGDVPGRQSSTNGLPQLLGGGAPLAPLSPPVQRRPVLRGFLGAVLGRAQRACSRESLPAAHVAFRERSPAATGRRIGLSDPLLYPLDWLTRARDSDKLADGV
ncbi:unnamed protein product, partial [Prorocentrum cordatum]